MISNKRIFITGGGGFIGSWICQKLVHDNEIIVYDNSRRDAISMSGIKENKNLKFISGDILDRERLLKSIPEVEMVIHLAAIAGVSSYYEMPHKTMEVNIIGTYYLLEALKDKKIERYLDFSTSEVYGGKSFHSPEDGYTAQGDIADPRWTYAISKLAGEKLSYCYKWKYQLPIVTIRPFNIYGPYQVGEGAIQSFATKAIKNLDLPITGDGTQIRAWCYIEDFLEAVFSCLESEQAVGQTFNIGNPDEPITTVALAKKIIGMLDSKSKIIFKDHIGTDIELRVPDISKARKLLDYGPKVCLEDGLKSAISWYKESQ